MPFATLRLIAPLVPPLQSGSVTSAERVSLLTWTVRLNTRAQLPSVTVTW